MKKNFLFGVLTVLLAGFGFGGVSLAASSEGCTKVNGNDLEGEPFIVAKIGETNCYTSLREAISAAGIGDIGTEIIMVDNDDGKSFTSEQQDQLEMSIGKNLTIDGKGFTLYGVNTWGYDWVHFHRILIEAGDITIKNLTISNFGKDLSVQNRIIPIYVSNDYEGTLNLKDLTIEHFNRHAISIRGGTVNIEGCDINGASESEVVKDGNNEYYQAGIEVADTKDTPNVNVTITDTDFTNINATTKWCTNDTDYGYHDANPEGCTEDDANSVDLFYGGNITIEGGTFDGEYSIILTEQANENGLITINGGEFKSAIGIEEGTNGNLQILGGTFSVDPNEYLSDDYCSIKNNDGTFGVVECPEYTAFITSNDNILPVVFDAETDGYPITLNETKALFKKIETPTDPEDVVILNYILEADNTKGAEIKKIGDEFVLFFSVNKVNPTSNATKAFRQNGSTLFGANSFKINGTPAAENYPEDGLGYGTEIYPSWMEGGLNPDKYNEVKDGDNTIGYTLHTANGGWFYAPKKFTVTFVDEDETTVLKEATAYDYGTASDAIEKPANPTKAADDNYTYTFKAWNPELKTVTADITYKATYTKTAKKSSYSGGGGSSSSKKTETTKEEDAKANTGDTAKLDDTKANENANEENKNEGSNADGATASAEEFSQEFIDAYNFAHKNGITTKESIDDADMYGPLTRIAMAKMLSQYAINVLGKTPDTSKVVPTFPDVDAKLDADYDNGVTLAYQLGIMGIGIQEFRPFAEVTRAEFGTALSRMLFGTADGEGNEWYKTHLDKLMLEKIITNDDPNLKELRGYVMIMLMRSASDK